MQDITTKTIREIAIEQPMTTRIFEELKIDYCCGGHKPFTEACEAANADTEAIKKRIEAIYNADSPKDASTTPEFMPAWELVDHIVCTHHDFTRDEIAALMPLAEKVSGKHGGNHPELIDIRDDFRALADDLLLHMQKEEMMLFPYIKQVTRASYVPISPFGSVRNPIQMMMTEHDVAGEILQKMRKASDNYQVPDDACPSFRALYTRLENLEKDLHQHIHLENNVLFPTAVEAEEKLGSGSEAQAGSGGIF